MQSITWIKLQRGICLNINVNMEASWPRDRLCLAAHEAVAYFYLLPQYIHDYETKHCNTSAIHDLHASW